jgi:hypothetical protein
MMYVLYHKNEDRLFYPYIKAVGLFSLPAACGYVSVA